MFVFEPSGRLVSEVPLPSRTLYPGGPLGPALVGAELQSNMEVFTTTSWRHMEIDVASGEILWQRVFPADMAADAGCPPRPEGVVIPERVRATLPPPAEGMRRALTFPDGGMVFTMLCRGQMLFLADRDDERERRYSLALRRFTRAPRSKPRHSRTLRLISPCSRCRTGRRARAMPGAHGAGRAAPSPGHRGPPASHRDARRERRGRLARKIQVLEAARNRAWLQPADRNLLRPLRTDFRSLDYMSLTVSRGSKAGPAPPARG